ncbi:MAG TPA: carboxypeptidase-like regulatory domain-containing protein [Vicinamibacterales bacterium]|nr:carboxypeptidase-like regulatory domain-containing protein [Vicinamibacterales bacterium]
MRLLSQMLLAAAVLAPVSCDTPKYTPPAAPSPTPQTTPAPTIPSVSGFVLDTANRSIVDALAEALDGPRVLSSTNTDGQGRFTLTGSFSGTTLVRVTKRGFLAGIQPAAPTMWFMLPIDGPSLNLAGSYTLTLDVDPLCTDLPADLRTRVYQATVSADASAMRPANTLFYAQLSGATFDRYYHFVVLEVAGDFVTFDFSDNYILEEVAPESYLAVGGVGGASAVSGGSEVSARLDGTIDYCVVKSDKGSLYPCQGDMVTHVQCESKNHRLTLTRR